MAHDHSKIGGCTSDKARTAQEIARRALALGSAVSLSFKAPRKKVAAFVEEAGLVDELTATERDYVFSTRRSAKATINMSWNAEALVVLLWAINKIKSIPAAHVQCSTGDLADALPPFGLESLPQFIGSLKRRPEKELSDMADSIQEQHVIARQRKSNPAYRSEAGEIDIEIVQERHRAINWVVGYCGESWDEVTADT